jgi:hypothetical protein
MTTISGTFTEDGVSSVLVLGNAIENVDLTIAAPFDGTLQWERDKGGELSWEVIGKWTDQASVSKRYVSRPNDRLRLRLLGLDDNFITPLTTSTAWTAGAGWAIAEGVATRTAGAATPNLTTSLSGLVPGATYTVTFDMTTTAGTMTISLGGGTASAALNEADDEVSVNLVAGSTNTTLAFIAAADFAGTVTSVVVTHSVGYSFSDGLAVLRETKDGQGTVVETLTEDGALAVSGGFSFGGTALTATAAEINSATDASTFTQTITEADAIDLDARHVKITGPATSTYAVTLAAPTVGGIVKVIEMVATTSTNAVTLALTNVVGGSAATTATFNAAGEILTLVSAGSKWVVLDEFGVTLS